jgi:lysophospholipase L1-like esterase
MIERDGVEFHNVAELVPCEHPQGIELHRYPRDVASVLSTLGHHAAACSDGVELRFVTAPSWVSVTLSARSNYPFSDGATARVYRGDILVEEHEIPDGATRTLKLMEPERLGPLPAATFAEGRFAPNVWRIVFSHATVVFHGVDAAGKTVRPPTEEEKPRRLWLAYGSSITNSTPGYVEHAARHLGVDVANKGLSGSCQCEPEVATYLTDAEAWDFATLELGVNMRGAFDAKSFDERARHLTTEVVKAAGEKPVFLITMFPNYEDYIDPPNDTTQINRAFRSVLERIHADLGASNLHLVNGAHVLPTPAALSADMVHPSGDGHQLMGSRLAEIMRPKL